MRVQEAFKKVEELDVEITFLSTNTSEIHLHVEQLLQNTYWMLAEDLRLPKGKKLPRYLGPDILPDSLPASCGAPTPFRLWYYPPMIITAKY